MATDRQIEANRKNAAASTGPRTEPGKAASRLNATRHGMASASPAVEADQSPEFQARKTAWAAEYPVASDVQSWSLDRAVAASIRIERCEQAFEGAAESTAERARLSWEQDRTLDAARLGARLAGNPSVVARDLESSWHGVALMIQWWTRLLEILKAGDDWSEAQASTALDLLGVPIPLRGGRTPIDGPGDGPHRSFRQNLVTDEVDRLEQLQRMVLSPIDELDREQAISGDSLLLAPPAKLILRYEREAWRRYRESIRELTHPKGETEPPPTPRVESPPVPVPVSTPRPGTPSEPEEDERAIHQSMVRRARAGVAQMMREMGIEEFPAELDALYESLAVDGTNPILDGFDDEFPDDLDSIMAEFPDSR